MYCQQILRQTWHGNVPWQAAPITFKLIHFLLQVILAPLFACIELTSQVVKENARLFHIKVNFFNKGYINLALSSKVLTRLTGNSL